MRFCVAGRRSQVTVYGLAWRPWLVGHEGCARLHPHDRRMSGPRAGDFAPSLAVLTEVRAQSQPGDMVLSCSTADRDELATQGQAASLEAATIGRGASLSNGGLKQCRASAAARDR